MGCARCVGRHKKAQSRCVPLADIGLTSQFTGCASLALHLPNHLSRRWVSSWTEVQCLSFSNSATLTLRQRQGGDAMTAISPGATGRLETAVEHSVFCSKSVAPLDVRPTPIPRVAFLMGTTNTCGQVACAPAPQRTRGPAGPARLAEVCPALRHPPADLVSAPLGQSWSKNV